MQLEAAIEDLVLQAARLGERLPVDAKARQEKGLRFDGGPELVGLLVTLARGHARQEFPAIARPAFCPSLVLDAVERFQEARPRHAVEAHQFALAHPLRQPAAEAILDDRDIDFVFRLRRGDAGRRGGADVGVACREKEAPIGLEAYDAVFREQFQAGIDRGARHAERIGQPLRGKVLSRLQIFILYQGQDPVCGLPGETGAGHLALREQAQGAQARLSSLD